MILIFGSSACQAGLMEIRVRKQSRPQGLIGADKKLNLSNQLYNDWVSHQFERKGSIKPLDINHIPEKIASQNISPFNFLDQFTVNSERNIGFPLSGYLWIINRNLKNHPV